MANQKIQLKSVNGNKLFPRTSINNIVGEDFTTVVSIPVLDGTGKIKAENLPSFVDDVIELVAVSETAPASCAAGDMYFNSGSTNKKIYTATAANTWGTTGVEPEKSKIYVNTTDNCTACLACVHVCPQQAISTNGRETLKERQYRHPDIKLKDLIKR